jgi:CelD/BcsL family acetyltransferase involved in cellulose biosynthesis
LSRRLTVQAGDAMNFDVLPISDLGSGDLNLWAQLAETAIAPNPFAEPGFVLPAARAWRVDDLELLVVRDGTDWRAALPVRRVRSWRGVPGRALAAWRHSYCYLGTPLVHGTAVEATLATLVEGGLGVRGSLALDWIDADGPLAEPLMSALTSQSHAVVLEEFERAALYRREENGTRHPREYRRKYKQLERAVGPLTLRDESDDPKAFERFLELERSGWKGKKGTAMACRTGHAAFFTEMAEAFTSSGRFRMLSLISGDRPLAMRNELLAGDTTFTFKIAFDEEFSRYSPGIQLEILAIDLFQGGTHERSDSCTPPENASLNRLWPERRALRSVVASTRSAPGAVSYAKWRGAVRARALRRKLRRPEPGVRGH